MSNSTPHHICHRWTIDDISNKLFNTRGYPCFNSPPFTLYLSTSASSPPQFELRLYPKGVNDNFKCYLSVGLFSCSFGGQLKCLLRCKFSLIDHERQKKNTKEMSCCFSSEEYCSVLGQFITKSNLTNPTNGFVWDGKLTLDCQITILGEPSLVGYFDSFVNHLNFLSKSNLNLMVDLYHDLAFQHKVNEFPDCAPLDLPFDVSLEETMTHHANFGLAFGSTTLNNRSGGPAGPYSLMDFFELVSISRKKTLLDLKFTIDGSKYCDVVLLVEGKQYRAFKAILAAQSSVFEALFSHDMKEKCESQVSITDVTAQVFEQFLNYLYTGKFFTKDNWEIMELFEIADKYTVELLKQQCENILCRQIITKDAIEILQLSERYSLERLKKIASKFEPTLWTELFSELALKYRHNELPNHVPLDLPCSLIPDETVTHWTGFNLSFDSTLAHIWLSSQFPVIYANPIGLKFRIEFSSVHKCLSIFYLSTEKVFVDLFVTCWYDKMSPKFITNKHFSEQLSAGSKSLDLKVDFFLPSLNIEKYIVNLKITIYKESSRKVGLPEKKSLSRQQTLMNLKTIVDCGKFCDVTLHVEGKQFRAHKSILANRSNVFGAMFRYDWKEKMDNRVEMHDVKVEAFEQFLLYLYTAKVDSEILKMHAMDLFVLADMHYLSTLSQLCLRVFGQTLTPESVHEQFELADRLGLIEFKQVCTDYMNRTT